MSLANDEKEVLFALNALVSSNKEREVSFLNTTVLASSENSRPRFASDLKLSAKPSEKDVSATVAAVSPSVSFTMPWPKSLKVSALYVVSALVSKMSRKPLKNPLTPSTVILALLAGGGG
ncbi:wsv018 [White spot syndrome virus]|uniref:Wsv018 n=4 Tax=White spot syndrome virus TaxID=342409 RepID=Q8VBE3_WSSVS|nr:wsv018 [Shrimp white spot syndrome virus]AFX59395.1 wsv018 [White spot syndrome virus]AAL33022.1 wsv018 [Shrimp white spot syndrome virus]AAL88942.1 WSSV074 [Shrimp white spot syndrome virus]AWQ60208.1 wsv018 [Shrimp white spot syndrome virus]AWQ60628.1 wsv018 [Shrimp white spot syndrome virus]